MITITPKEAKELISSTNGKFFSVLFRKRSNNELREMVCRTKVHKHLKGGEKKYDAEEKGLLTVYSIDSKGYRCIPLENLKQVCLEGKAYKVRNLKKIK